MTQTRYISGQPGIFQSIFKAVSFIMAAIVSVFLLMIGGIVAFFLIGALLVLGLVAFVYFWAKAKITGRPFGPKAQFEQARRDMEAQFQNYRETAGDGPIIEAHDTPDGWSVED
ncbi:MAG: hypothetical protein HKN36_11805 [Hellea sp.]|nr:hypothetical protein [Hellea sp.]